MKTNPTHISPNHNISRDNDQKYRYYKGQRIPKEYLELAESMESQYYEKLLNEMSKDLSGEKKSFAEDYYKSMQNHERAKIMAKSDKSAGIKDLVLNQILPQQYKQQINKMEQIKNYQKHVSNQGEQHE